MKRPPGLWVLLSAGVLWLSLQDVYGIRATALIFGRSTSSTTPVSEEKAADEPEESTTELSGEISNVTKPTLTGNPQLDYIYDPNLPKELNGYNLSAYPFYERVPEDIDFKCDGLHDGFYASIPHKCQVYHHCLFGTRYDFLCANYTAFDQKTFICHFVSEVDCVNSKKYWHRNDALYQEASTTTTTPRTINLSFYTPPPQSHLIGNAPGSAPAAPAPAPDPGLTPAAAYPPYRTRRPFYRPHRRRPQYDYDYEYDDEYDDDYIERPRRKRPPHRRPRPVYKDDYADEYDDERYERRRPYRDRRPSDRRRNKDRRKSDDDDKAYDEDEEEDKRRYNKRRPSAEYDDGDDRRQSRPKHRRPVDDYEDDSPPKEKAPESAAKPITGSIYNRSRPTPKIKPPVPKNEAHKYAYKPATTKPPAVEDEEEYEDDYEEPTPKPKKQFGSSRRDEERSNRKPPSDESESKKSSNNRRDERKPISSASRIRPQSARDPDDEDSVSRRPTKSRPKFSRGSTKKPPPVEEYYDDDAEYEDETNTRSKSKMSTTTTPKPTLTTRTTTTTTTTTTTPKPTTSTAKDVLRDRPDSIVRIVKRPFLPSRGGNPYSARGLQPVGVKADDKEELNTDSNTDVLETKAIFKPSPVIIKVPVLRQTTAAPQDEFKPVSNRPQLPPRANFKPNKEYSGPRTTQKPKITEVDPLDIENDEYDVTLNDALNPTLPNLPIRSFPTGFSNGNDYTYIQRQRYVPPTDSGNSQDYYQNKQVRQRYEAVPYTNSQNQFVNTNSEYKGQYSTIQGQNYRPRLTQAYFSSY